MKRAFFSLRLIDQGILKRASGGLRLPKKGMLHLKRPSCFGLWLLEQGILHLRRPTVLLVYGL